ncbi:MAG TPA: GntR family transcriptional regulator [Burkholderiaceae bacterium]|nr:GntR family transcriptional regulator [Burkholderiaceae bacterium]
MPGLVMNRRKSPSRAMDGVPPRNGTQSNLLAQQLEEMIFSGQLKPGEKLEEAAIAARFGVSRTPVREAVQRLVATGMVQVRRRAGTIVTQLTMSRLIGMIEMMAEMDILAARLTARRATPDERVGIGEIIERARAAVGDQQAYTRLNREFHWSLYAATHNEYLEETALRTWKVLQPYRNFRLDQPARRQSSLDEHESIYQAIRASDGELAGRQMASHVKVGGVIADFVFSLPAHSIEKG